MKKSVAAIAVWLLGGAVVCAQPLKLHPENPRYLLFRDKPTVLIGSSEHYGAVINRDFNYVRYLDTLQSEGLNVTRVFSGAYRERAGEFGTLPQRLEGRDDFEIVENTLAPNPNAYVAPWPRSPEPGAADGLNKFDLERWNPEYFARLRDFVEQASRRDIVVEVSLFSTYYVNTVGDHFWRVSPWNHRNNINAIGDIDAEDALTLKDGKLLAVQEALVRKIVTELRDFDNVYYEIANEPHWGHVSLDWQAHIAKLIVETESSLGTQHLILQEFADLSDWQAIEQLRDPQARQFHLANGIEKRLPEVSLLAFHTSHPRVLTNNYALAMPIGDNESVLLISDAENRRSAWRIMLAGGAFHHGTDYSFTRGHEDGSFKVPAGGVGGGSADLRRQLGILRRFMDGLDFIHMKPAPEAIRSGLPSGAQAWVLAEPSQAYAIYIDHGRPRPASSGSMAHSVKDKIVLGVDLPRGRYFAQWIDTKHGGIAKEEAIAAGSRATTLVSPEYSEDIALRIVRTR